MMLSIPQAQSVRNDRNRAEEHGCCCNDRTEQKSEERIKDAFIGLGQGRCIVDPVHQVFPPFLLIHHVLHHHPLPLHHTGLVAH